MRNYCIYSVKQCAFCSIPSCNARESEPVNPFVSIAGNWTIAADKLAPTKICLNKEQFDQIVKDVTKEAMKEIAKQYPQLKVKEEKVMENVPFEKFKEKVKEVLSQRIVWLDNSTVDYVAHNLFVWACNQKEEIPRWKKIAGCAGAGDFAQKVFLVKLASGNYTLTSAVGPDDTFIELSEIDKWLSR